MEVQKLNITTLKEKWIIDSSFLGWVLFAFHLSYDLTRPST